MNRLFFGVTIGLLIIASVTLVSRPGVVNATWPELRQVSDPARERGLNLGFAEVSGAFLGGVTLIIEDPEGTELINTVVDGPWFFTPLPAGSYNVKAIYDDQMKQIKDIRLSDNKVTMVVVYWDLNVPATQMMARAAGSLS